MIQKQRPEKNLAHIHSKPVIYMSNGGGRDSYIALNDGGFRPMHIAGSSNATYYNSLRQYARNGNRTVSKRKDDFVES